MCFALSCYLDTEKLRGDLFFNDILCNNIIVDYLVLVNIWVGFLKCNHCSLSPHICTQAEEDWKAEILVCLVGCCQGNYKSNNINI